jgi:glutathione S-transferase
MVDYLRAEAIAGRFARWDYPAMSLYCLLDWAAFRGTLTEQETDGPLAAFMSTHRMRPQVDATDPRRI